jgi:hypothetical protein
LQSEDAKEAAGCTRRLFRIDSGLLQRKAPHLRYFADAIPRFQVYDRGDKNPPILIVCGYFRLKSFTSTALRDGVSASLLRSKRLGGRIGGAS